MANEKPKQFLFMYPIDQIFDIELEKDAFLYLSRKGLLEDTPAEMMERFRNAKTKEEQKEIQKEERVLRREQFRPIYSAILNLCIRERYRQNGFGINYLVFDDTPVSNVIEMDTNDRVLYAGIDSFAHFDKKMYPNPCSILAQFEPEELKHLRLAGFHMWDCVERLARHAHERNIDVLVDEDLTQFLAYKASFDDFKFDSYPGFNPRKNYSGSGGFEGFMEPRKGKPWLLQDYPK